MKQTYFFIIINHIIKNYILNKNYFYVYDRSRRRKKYNKVLIENGDIYTPLDSGPSL